MLGKIRDVFKRNTPLGMEKAVGSDHAVGIDDRAYIERVVDMRVALVLEELSDGLRAEREQHRATRRVLEEVSEKFIEQFRRERELKAEILALGHQFEMLNSSLTREKF